MKAPAIALSSFVWDLDPSVLSGLEVTTKWSCDHKTTSSAYKYIIQTLVLKSIQKHLNCGNR